MTKAAASPAPELGTDSALLGRALEILASNRIMAISTLRADGWPQTTIVGYVNDGLAIYFMILRSSQKFSNIQNDARVSIAVGQEPKTLREAAAVFAAARAAEVTGASARAAAWRLLEQRHPNLADFKQPAAAEAAIMCAQCEHVSVVDYAKGLGHCEAFDVAGYGDAAARPMSPRHNHVSGACGRGASHSGHQSSAPPDLPGETRPMTSPALDLAAHHRPRGLSDRVALAFTKLLRWTADTFFAERYGHRAVVLETVAAVPGMAGRSDASVHRQSRRRHCRHDLGQDQRQRPRSDHGPA